MTDRAEPPPTRPERAREHEGVRRARTICLAGIGLAGAYSVALVPLVPSLLGRNPVLLEALRASTAAMVAGGAFARIGQASLVLALVAPLPTLMMADPFVWWAGRLWGPAAAGYLGGRGPRGQRRTERAVRLLERYDAWAVMFAYVLPVPSPIIYAAAGWTGMSLRRFLALDLAGTFLWIALIVGLGYGIGSSAVAVAHEITHYSLLVTVAVVVLIVAGAAGRGIVRR